MKKSDKIVARISNKIQKIESGLCKPRNKNALEFFNRLLSTIQSPKFPPYYAILIEPNSTDRKHIYNTVLGSRIDFDVLEKLESLISEK